MKKIRFILELSLFQESNNNIMTPVFEKYWDFDLAMIHRKSPGSSHRRCSLNKKVVLKIFAIFTGKSLCWSIFLITNFNKKSFQHLWIVQNFAKNFAKAPILKNICKCLLLDPWGFLASKYISRFSRKELEYFKWQPSKTCLNFLT